MRMIKSKKQNGHKPFRLRELLFLRYFAASFLLLAGVELILFLFMYRYNYTLTISNQKRICRSVSDSIIQQINHLDSRNMDLIYSNEMIHLMRTRQRLLKDENKVNSELDYNTFECYETVRRIKGYSEAVKQLNIYDPKGMLMGAGAFDGYTKCNPDMIAWLDSAADRNGRIFLTSLHKYEWLSTFPDQNPKISVVREFNDLNSKPYGFVEAAADCSRFFEAVDNMGGQDLSIFIFNDEGSLIYPYLSNPGEEIISEASAAFDFETGSIVSQSERGKIITGLKAGEGLPVFVLISPKSIVYRQFLSLAPIFVIQVVLFFLLSIFVSYMLANRISAPLNDLSRQLQKLKFNDIEDHEPFPLQVDTDIFEIRQMLETLNAMESSMLVAIKNQMVANNEKVHSQVMALNAQMNPHFLYNNLTNISVLIEENMNREAMELCKALCYMMRYTSSNAGTVFLAQELEHINNYFFCQKIRYSDSITLELEIPEEMESIVIPKLSIQPFLENSIKYGLTKTPPWNMVIRGELTNGWKIEIKDNGPGFSDESLSNINESIHSYLESGKIPAMTVDGMGILNIFIRMHLYYGEDTIFEIENLKEGGAVVRMGAKSVSYELEG